MSDTCQMIKRAWVNDDPCGQLAVATHQSVIKDRASDLRICAECAAAMQKSEPDFVIVFDARACVGERYRFTYPNEPWFNRDLLVVEITGNGPDDLVLFADHSHTKQKHIGKVEKLP